MTRRDLLVSFTTAAGSAWAQGPQRAKMWKPRLGVLGKFSEANLEFARGEGFTSIGLWANPKSRLDVTTLTDAQFEMVKSAIARSGLHLSVLASVQNHISPDADARNRANAYFSNVITLAGRLGVPYVGTSSGTMPGRPLLEQVDQIVRVYTEKYFPLCEKYRVRILWEPWAGGPNIATGPVGYEALFKAFGASPHVGLQYDPSHLVWQMMDPIQCARDFVDKIYDIHLKDTEILWPVLRKVGINPVNNARWWRFRLPGFGAIDWAAFFTVLMDAGYEGAMNIEHEDALYGWPYPGDDFSEEYKTGFRVAHRYLRQFVPD
ncbi:MAG: sugar phosphate isomerase/epimerase [Acidobacteria bacterium]|nr:sugar phosphate isomerase/epimerase [Acidobacteriota bacterium]